MDEPSDAELITRSLTEPTHFAEIFDRHAATLLAYCNRRLRRADAEDVLGEVFRIAFETRRRFDRSHSSALPWLYGITANLITKQHRSTARQARAVNRLTIASDAPSDVPFDESVAQHAVDVELLASVRELIDDLPPGDREVLVLYAWEGLRYDEIARAMGLPVGTVRSRLNRVRGQLRELRDRFGEQVGVPSQRAPEGVS